MGQTQPQSLAQRVEAAAKRLVERKEPGPVVGTVTEPTPEATSDASPPVTGAITATGLVMTENYKAPAMTGGAPNPSDVQLVRDQLELVVTNFRSRLDRADEVVTSLKDDVEHAKGVEATAQAMYTSLKSVVDEHSGLIDSIVAALEAIK